MKVNGDYNQSLLVVSEWLFFRLVKVWLGLIWRLMRYDKAR